MNKKMLTAEIIKMLPDKWSHSVTCQFFEQLAEVYRKKSRKDIYREEAKDRAKGK